MEKASFTPKDRVGLDGRNSVAKAGRNPIGSTLTQQERLKIIAALETANDKFKLFPKK
jgi:hypothetical protein